MYEPYSMTSAVSTRPVNTAPSFSGLLLLMDLIYLIQQQHLSKQQVWITLLSELFFQKICFFSILGYLYGRCSFRLGLFVRNIKPNCADQNPGVAPILAPCYKEIFRCPPKKFPLSLHSHLTSASII